MKQLSGITGELFHFLHSGFSPLSAAKQRTTRYALYPAKCPIEAFNIRILRGLTRLNKFQFHAVLFRPAHKLHRYKLGPVVHVQFGRITAPGRNTLKAANHSYGR